MVRQKAALLSPATSTTPSPYDRRLTDDISAWTTRIGSATPTTSKGTVSVNLTLRNGHAGNLLLGSQQLPIDISNDDSDNSTTRPLSRTQPIKKQPPANFTEVGSTESKLHRTQSSTSRTYPENRVTNAFKNIAPKASGYETSNILRAIPQHITHQSRVIDSRSESNHVGKQRTLAKSFVSIRPSTFRDSRAEVQTTPIERSEPTRIIVSQLLPLRGGSSPCSQVVQPSLAAQQEQQTRSTNRVTEPRRSTQPSKPISLATIGPSNRQEPSSHINGSTKSSSLSDKNVRDITPNSSVSRKVVSIDLPVNPIQKEKQRRDWIEKLKVDTSVIHEHADIIHDENMVGLTGFCKKTYPVNCDAPQVGKLTSKKRRHPLLRADVSLDLDVDDFNQTFNQSHLHLRRPKHKLTHPRKQVESILTARFSKITPALAFVENDQHKYIDGKFQFVSHYVFREGVSAARQKRKVSKNVTRCDCVGGSCGMLCACVQAPRTSGATEGFQQIQTYQRNRHGQVVLTNEFLETWDPTNDWARRCEILECSDDHCSCGPDCLNRVVQRGRTLPLQIFLTRLCGFGIRSSCDIVQGQFIDTYLGEVLTAGELKRREDALEPDQPSYSFELDWFVQEENQKWHIDGREFGSPMRFVNHSCEPNTRVITVASSTGERQLHYLAFFAIKDIPAGQEVLIDYDPSLALQPPLDSQGIAGLPSEVTRCMCGSSNCRGRVWREGQERRTRRRLGALRK